MEWKASSIVFVVIINCFLLACVFSKKMDDFELVQKRIVSGVLTVINEYPFMAALGWANNQTGEVDFLSGGMLITPNFVLTAAHCVYLNGKLPSTIEIGGNRLNSTFNEIHKAKAVFTHPNYTDDNRAYYDIALLELEETSGRHPVSLWAKPLLHTQNVTAIGYGTTQFAGTGSPKLLKVDLVVFSEEVCKPFFKRQRKFRFGIRDSHMCAGDPEGRRDTCQGDSGGPLMVEYNRTTYAVGVTSTGQACSGLPPAIYTRISSYIDWIEDAVKTRGYSTRKTSASS